MATHTPGPWTVEPETHVTLRVVAGDDGDCVCTLFAGTPADTRRADAHLLAAAPDLLAALEALVAQIRAEGGKGYRVHDLADAGLAAIAKARGA